jgi:hypothetical protein
MGCIRRSARVLALGALAACGDPASRWEPGGIYSTSDGSGFGVVKVLAVEPDAVSVRVYRERFPHRPPSVDPSGLSLGSIDDPNGFGVGHLPLAPRDFALWFPVHLATVPVTDSELEGYRAWKEAGGGVFSGDEMEEGQ